jgi:glyoxylase-like metal-dependent hydrolase (beta-lactamase superfamily II)
MYTIRPLKQAEIMVPLGVVQILGDMQRLVVGPVYIWYLEGDIPVVIDAGIQEPVNGFVHNFPVLGGGENGVREALSKAGVKPEDIEILIITHLHFDHVANVQLFHNARIFVQKKEWKSAFDPPIHYRLVYDTKMIQPLEDMDLCLIDGDVKIAEGLRAVFLPGHTEGHQGVAIETDKGTYLMAGDHFYTRFNLNPPKEPIEMEDVRGNKVQLQPSPIPFVPPGLHVDLREWFDSCFKALSVTRREKIIPGHDPDLVDKVIP